MLLPSLLNSKICSPEVENMSRTMSRKNVGLVGGERITLRPYDKGKKFRSEMGRKSSRVDFPTEK